MVRPELLLADRERPLQQRPRAGWVARRIEYVRQADQGGRDVRMLGPELLFVDRERPLVKRPRAGGRVDAVEGSRLRNPTRDLCHAAASTRPLLKSAM